MFMTAEEALRALFQKDYIDSDFDSYSNAIPESVSNIPIDSDDNKISSSQHVHTRIISQPANQVIDKISTGTNAQESAAAVYAQTRSHLSIQCDQPLHTCDIEMDIAMQISEENTSSVPIVGE